MAQATVARGLKVPRFERGRLGDLAKLAEGGQGIVYEAPRVRINQIGAAVYKEYKAAVVPDVDVHQLETMVALLDDLDPASARKLVGCAAWPLAIVSNGPRIAGFAMPKVPDEFYVRLRMPAGPRVAMGQFQHLFNTKAWLDERGLPGDQRFRLALLANLAENLAFFHATGIAVGDLSAKNLLFSLGDEPRCYFIDCDAMVLRDGSVLPQFETPDWDVRSVSKEPVGTAASDVYKFGLVALRLFAMDQTVRDPALAYGLPTSLLGLLEASLSRRPSRRPAIDDWTRPLAKALRSPGRTYVAPVPRVPSRFEVAARAAAADVSARAQQAAAERAEAVKGSLRVPVGRVRNSVVAFGRRAGALLGALLLIVVGAYAASFVGVVIGMTSSVGGGRVVASAATGLHTTLLPLAFVGGAAAIAFCRAPKRIAAFMLATAATIGALAPGFRSPVRVDVIASRIAAIVGPVARVWPDGWALVSMLLNVPLALAAAAGVIHLLHIAGRRPEPESRRWMLIFAGLFVASVGFAVLFNDVAVHVAGFG